MWILRVFSSVVFLTSIILSIPLAFDVGGRACGLAFSLSISSFYFSYSILRLATPEKSRYQYILVQVLAWTQWAVLPTLLIWSLNRFSVEPVDNSSWVERTFSGKRAQDASIREWIFGPDGLAETVTVGSWDKLLRWSTPVFQLCEGFCSLLVIQAAGQITRWLVNRGGRSDSWMVCSKPAQKYLSLFNDCCVDRLACHLCVGDLKLSILPLESQPFSRDRKRGCHSYWNNSHLRRFPLRLGYWQRERKSC